MFFRVRKLQGIWKLYAILPNYSGNKGWTEVTVASVELRYLKHWFLKYTGYVQMICKPQKLIF